MYPEVQDNLFYSFPAQTNTHIQAILAMPLLLIMLKEGSECSSIREKASFHSVVPQQLSQKERICSVSVLDSESTWISKCTLKQALQ